MLVPTESVPDATTSESSASALLWNLFLVSTDPFLDYSNAFLKNRSFFPLYKFDQNLLIYVYL